VLADKKGHPKADGLFYFINQIHLLLKSLHNNQQNNTRFGFIYSINLARSSKPTYIPDQLPSTMILKPRIIKRTFLSTILRETCFSNDNRGGIMPELPDLQVYSKNLMQLLKDKRLISVKVHSDKNANVDEKQLNDTLAGKKLNRVYRLGKQLYFEFAKEAILALHLMLHGKLVYSKEDKPKYTLVALQFEHGETLAITDFQKMAHITLNPAKPEAIDALDAAIPQQLPIFAQGSKKAIKTLLMDQHIIGGIGNAYADEILYEAGIAPQSVANKIPKTILLKLAKTVDQVLSHAEKKIMKDHPDIISGEVRDFMKIHANKEKTDARGKAILKEKIGGRMTYYTEDQKLFQ